MIYTNKGFTPAIFIIESAIDHLARSLKIDPEELKEMNMYRQGDISYVVRDYYSNIVY